MEGKNAVVAAVRGLVNAVNSADFGTAVAAFTDAPVIIEDIAPYIWRGRDAPSDWLSAMGANAARQNIQSVLMTVAQATRVELVGDAAYAVFPGHLILAAGEADLVAEGMLTFTLQSTGGRWLIDSLVWSGPEPVLRAIS
jgi:hypothetical protein